MRIPPVVTIALCAAFIVSAAGCAKSPAPASAVAPESDGRSAEPPLPTASEVQSAFSTKLAEAESLVGKASFSGFTLGVCQRQAGFVYCDASMTMSVDGALQTGTHRLQLVHRDGAYVLAALPGTETQSTGARTIRVK
jgi:hypothetical protein